MHYQPIIEPQHITDLPGNVNHLGRGPVQKLLKDRARQIRAAAELDRAGPRYAYHSNP